ncbi:YidB family protein [Anaeromyxobacter diazotrophicus]|uniref:DUF937 domain-containing protein n=1 Tax=Anaeromyxobacter diazotrophicus TaxID=2590199 RepID=A0A7I9VU40_9BACT|nr:YidB family protein [Anaeromyxobacter diazotrophicus]GEJ59477.1 hypothetical protein AMYX_42180 [Anaeromyxobacter diazotrophicus]
MGILDGLRSSLLGGAAGQAQSPLAASVLGMLGGGGLGSLVGELRQGGLGKIVESWIGTGQNLPVSAEQLQQALGPKVQALAQQHGLSPDAVSQALSQLLPQLIDHLTPNGQLPQGTGAEQGLAALRSKLGI